MKANSVSNQDQVKWEIVEQIVWLVALAGTAIILLLKPVAERVGIPVTGAGEQVPASMQMLEPRE